MRKKPNFYEYSDLQTRKEKRKRTVECKISYEDVEVWGLLDGIFVKERMRESLQEEVESEATSSYILRKTSPYKKA